LLDLGGVHSPVRQVASNTVWSVMADNAV